MSDFIGTKLTMNLGERSYDIILKNGALENLYQFARLDRRVAVVTDAGVPTEYAQRVADQCRDAKIITVPQGEASKSMKILESVLRQMLEFNMGRGDLVVAVGGAAVWGGYELVTRVMLHSLLPEGAAIPASRGQLALLVWNNAGRPEPAAQPAFADVADADIAKAAQWCVEQGIMEAKSADTFKPEGWTPKFKVIEAWNKAFPKQ